MFQTKSLFFIFLLIICSAANGQIITRYAGNDTSGFSGDGSSATAALLNNPSCARPDGSGNVYIADLGNLRIRKVNTAGIITSIAGNGSGTHGGDGGPATAAGLEDPLSLAIDGTGNLYILETGSAVDGPWVRKVDTFGIITNFAGSVYGYSGDGGPATAAKFLYVSDIVVDGVGNVYIADWGNNNIRKINTAGIITTIAGNGTPGYSGDGGQATAAELNNPWFIAVDSAGNVYISDSYNNRIRKVNSTGIITTIAGDGVSGFSGDGDQATTAELHFPQGIAVDISGNVYIADRGNFRIRRVSTSGVITTIAGIATWGYSGDGGPATAAQMIMPYGVSVDGEGNIYVDDFGAYNIRKISADSALNVPNISNQEQTLHTYPNPSDGTFTINISSNTTEPAQITITNLIGQKIKEIIATTNKEIETTLDAPPGMYFITAITAQGMQTGKIIVR